MVDVRPISGHVLYDSQYAPKLTEWKGKEIHYDFDYLEYYIEKAHSLGLKVQASLNTFVAGHNYMDSGPIYEEGKSEWASIIYTPDEEVKLIPITEEKNKYSAMVNPVNEEFQSYILNIFREIVEKYPELDGIILDRVRYDGFTADFRNCHVRNLKTIWEKQWIASPPTISTDGRKTKTAGSTPRTRQVFPAMDRMAYICHL